MRFFLQFGFALLFCVNVKRVGKETQKTLVLPVSFLAEELLTLLTLAALLDDARQVLCELFRALCNAVAHLCDWSSRLRQKNFFFSEPRFFFDRLFIDGIAAPR